MIRRSLAGRVLSWLLPLLAVALVLPVALSHWLQDDLLAVLLDASDAAIARSIIALAGSLGLSVIAEGVETTAHHQFLLAHGCQAFQGYLFGRPLTLEDFENRVRQGV